MAGYDVKAIMDKLAKLTEKKDSLTWAKLDIGSHNVRVLPMVTPDNQPLAELSFYRNEVLVGRWKVPTAAQFGLEDPIYEAVTELAKDRSKESWELRKQLNPQTSWFVPILIRGQEDKGVQIWEMKKEVMLQYLTHMTSEDYRDVNLLDPNVGHDWTVNVTASEKKFKTYTVKNFMMTPRPKPSKLAKDKEATDKLLAQVPDLFAYYKSRVLTPEQAREKLGAFLDRLQGDPMETSSEDGSSTRGVGEAAGDGDNTDDIVKGIEAGFADLG